MRQRHIEMRVWERHISIAVHGVTQTSIIVSVAAYWCDGRQSVAQQHPPCPGRQSSLIFSRVDVPKVQFVHPRSSSQRLQHAACVDLSRPRCETAMTGGVDVCAKDGMWTFTRGDATGGRGVREGARSLIQRVRIFYNIHLSPPPRRGRVDPGSAAAAEAPEVAAHNVDALRVVRHARGAANRPLCPCREPASGTQLLYR